MQETVALKECAPLRTMQRIKQLVHLASEHECFPQVRTHLQNGVALVHLHKLKLLQVQVCLVAHLLLGLRFLHLEIPEDVYRFWCHAFQTSYAVHTEVTILEAFGLLGTPRKKGCKPVCG